MTSSINWLRAAAFSVACSLLAACGGGGGGEASPANAGGGSSGGGISGGGATPPPADVTVTGSVGDGPIVNAQITVRDRDGVQVTTAVSNDLAKYSLTVPGGSNYPLTITATGGTDLVSTQAPQFDLVSVVVDAQQSTANISPISSVLVQQAICRGGLTAANLSAARTALANQLSVGYDSATMGDPITGAVGHGNVASVVKSNQVLAEIINRTSALLQSRNVPTTSRAVLDAFACDLSDDLLNGEGGSAASAEITATAQPVIAEVLSEAVRNRLNVDGMPAEDRLNAAIRRVLPDAPSTAVVESVPITPQLASELRNAIVVNIAADSEPTPLVNLAIALESVTAKTTAAALRDSLPADGLARVDELVENVRASTGDTVASLSSTVSLAAVRSQPPTPTLTLTARSTSVGVGTPAQLDYTSTGSAVCVGTAGISGPLKATSGTVTTPALTSPTTFTVSCVGQRGSISRSVTVAATGPMLLLTSDSAVVDRGKSVNLSWEGARLTDCVASGAWTGAKASAGRATVGPILDNSRFTLTCSNAGTPIAQSVNVAVSAPTLVLTVASPTVALAGGTTLTWTASNATACTASGGWTGSRAMAGSAPVSGLRAATDYRLRCTGPGGAVERLVTVGIAAPTLTLTSSSAKVDIGSKPTLTWTSTNATACTATGGWTGAQSLGGTAAQAAITAAATYNLNCTGPGGSIARTVSVALNPAVATFTADRTTIGQRESITLSWTSRNSSSCVAGGGWSGTKAVSGSQVVSSIENTSSFTLTCTGTGGASATQTVRVLVRPTATITASSTVVAPNRTVTLTWNSGGGGACVASGNDPAFQGTIPASGTRTSSPITGNWSFSIRCANSAGEAIASTSVSSSGTRVTWTQPSLQSDGTPIGVIEGYNVYFGRTSGKYEGATHIDGATNNAVVPLSTGTWFVAVTTLAHVSDGAGGTDVRESDYSPEIRKVVP